MQVNQLLRRNRVLERQIQTDVVSYPGHPDNTNPRGSFQRIARANAVDAAVPCDTLTTDTLPPHHGHCKRRIRPFFIGTQVCPAKLPCSASGEFCFPAAPACTSQRAHGELRTFQAFGDLEQVHGTTTRQTGDAEHASACTSATPATQSSRGFAFFLPLLL